jgi:Bcr/CflA subfamily drug resistance transporter
MTSLKVPSLWLITLIAGLPILSETIYVPSLPEIAEALNASENLVERTLTIYLFGFGIGVLFWGRQSDKVGRKPALLAGFVLYMLGSLGCWMSSSIEALLFWRFAQAFGGSTGSVLGQSIARDAIPTSDRAKAFATITMALGFAPAVGPVIGGYTAQYFGWSSVFIVLMVLALLSIFCIAKFLPETHLNRLKKEELPSLWKTACLVLKDPHVLRMGLLVGGCNGIIFSYAAESPFYFIEILKMEPKNYGLLGMFTASAYILGAQYVRKAHKMNFSNSKIIKQGCWFNFLGTIALTLLAFSGLIHISHGLIAIASVVVMMMIIYTANGIITPSALSCALENYGKIAGSAASIFGCFYYLVISGFTFLMSWAHNGTVYPMPFLFLGISILMLWMGFLYSRQQALAIKAA